jgi:CRISPR/Cas system-associated endoribonuclease Cas2
MITPTSLNPIKEQIKNIIDSIESIANLPPGKPIEPQVFQEAQKSLNNILSRLQFSLLEAEEEEEDNWELIDILYKAIKQCEDALRTVTAALLKQVLIRPDHDQIITDLQNIKRDIDAAIKAEKVLNFLISLAHVVIRFAGA